MKLYELTAELQFLLADPEGELTEDVSARIDALEMALPVKVEGVCCVIRTLQAEAEAAAVEVKRLRELEEVRRNKADGLKAYLKTCLERIGQSSVKTPLFGVRIQRNSVPSILLDCEIEALPTMFQKHRVDADRAALIEWWKAGKELPPGVKAEVGSHLRIS